MKTILQAIALLLFFPIFSQNNTEVFLFDLDIDGSSIELKNGKNISNNEGYDNQPSFMNDRYILFLLPAMNKQIL